MNDKLKERLKLKVAISQIVDEEKKAMNRRNFIKSKGIGIAACLIVATTGVAFANSKKIESFVKQHFNGSSDGVQTAVQNDYIETMEPVYIESDGIAISVDSFMIDDNNFNMDFRIQLSDKYNIKNMMMGMELYDLEVIDENGKVVFETDNAQAEKVRGVNETELKEKEKNGEIYTGGYGAHSEIIGNNEIMYYLSASENNIPFPKSKKLYVTFSKIHVRKDYNEKPLNEWYTGDWKFEIDVPEKMYNREITIYKPISCSDEKTMVENATLSNTSFRISISKSSTEKVDYELLKTSTPKNITDKIAFHDEYIETSDGKRFEISMDGNSGYSVPEGKNQIENYTQSFNLTSFDATEKLTVHLFTNTGQEIIIEYKK